MLLRAALSVHRKAGYADAKHVNVGSSECITVGELVQLVAEVAGLEGEIVRDTSEPNVTLRKLMGADNLRGLSRAFKLSLKSVYEDAVRYAEHMSAWQAV